MMDCEIRERGLGGAEVAVQVLGAEETTGKRVGRKSRGNGQLERPEEAASSGPGRGRASRDGSTGWDVTEAPGGGVLGQEDGSSDSLSSWTITPLLSRICRVVKWAKIFPLNQSKRNELGLLHCPLVLPLPVHAAFGL